MQAGAADTDAYLNDWRRGDPVDVVGDLDELAGAAVAEVQAAYGVDQLRMLIANGGYEMQ